MEAFSLLKYWRGGAAGAGAGTTNVRNTASTNATATTTTTTTTTIATTVQRLAMVPDEDDDEDEGPFFDLEFAVPDDDDDDDDDEDGEEHNDQDSGEEDEEDSAETDGEREFNFTVSSDTSVGGGTDPNLSLSPSDDLFFKGRLVPLEPSSLVFNPSEPNSKTQFPVSLLKSATKFRVFMLGFKKPKSTATEPNTNTTANTAQKPQQQNKFFTVKFKVEEVPIVSLFTRDNSSRISGSRTQKQQSDDSASATSDDKRFSKDVVQKYLKMIKPLYVKVSKRYGEKLRFSGQLSAGVVKSPTTKNEVAEPEEAEAANLKNQKQGNLPSGLRVVCKHLGKSRSASSAVAAVVPPLSAQSHRRDDSLLQQQDGIQSAIAHCKKSFTASKETEPSLPRSRSDTCDEKSVDSAKTYCEKGIEFCH